MTELLTLAQDCPRRTLDQGEVLITDGEPTDAVYVLLEGELRIEKAGVVVATLREIGACVGEMSLLLDTAATATVVAGQPSVLAVIEDAPTRLAETTDLSLALARMFARKLQGMTTYLVDIKQQYRDHEGGLGMVDVVLDTLMRSSGTRSAARLRPRPESRVLTRRVGLDAREGLLVDSLGREPSNDSITGVDLDVGRDRPRLTAGVEHHGRADPVDPAAIGHERRRVHVPAHHDCGLVLPDPGEELLVAVVPTAVPARR